jgi:hypothetical protein
MWPTDLWNRIKR